jgi:hypothetical protein
LSYKIENRGGRNWGGKEEESNHIEEKILSQKSNILDTEKSVLVHNDQIEEPKKKLSKKVKYWCNREAFGFV